MFYPIEKLANLHEGFRKAVKINNANILLIHHEGKAYLIESLCPHAAYPLESGVLVGSAIRCGFHGYLFDIPTGHCTLSTEGPCRNLITYQAVIVGDDIGVEL